MGNNSKPPFYLAAAMLTLFILLGYLLLDRKRFFHASSLQEAK